MCKYKKKEKIIGLLFILPLFIGLTIFYIIPFFQTLFYSFTDLGAFGKYTSINMDNYIRLFNDVEVKKALLNTLKIVIVTVPVITFLSIILSVLLNTKIKFAKIYRVLYIIPSIMMPSLVALIWRWLLNADYGLINNILRSLSLPTPNWISDKKYALFAVIMVYIWSKVGYNTVILLSGLKDIPECYYEAASLDGAGSIIQFFSITLPLLSPSIFFVVVTSFIESFQVFDLIFIMITENSIAIENVQNLIYLFYKYSFMLHEKGYASAIAIVSFLIIMIFTLIHLKLQDKYVYYKE
jgi:multiple sugar transport system permease protein